MVEKNTCLFRTGVKIHNWIYYSASDRNALYRVDFDEKKLEFLGLFPKQVVHTKSGIIGNEIWFLPENEDYFDIYNFKTGKFRQHKIREVNGYHPSNNNRRFSTFLHHEGKYYIVPGAYPYVMVVDENGEVERYIDIPDKYVTEAECEFHFSDGVIKGEWLYICPDINNYFIRVNIITDEVEAIKWNEIKTAYLKLIVFNECIYAVPVFGDAEFIEIKDDFTEYRKNGKSIDFEGAYYSCYAGLIGDCLWFMGVDSDLIIQFSLKEWREIKRLREPSKITAYRGCIEAEDAVIFPGKEKREAIVWIDKGNELKFKAYNEGTRGEIEYLINCIM